MSLSIAPGFYDERKLLVRHLTKAADLSRALRIVVDEEPLELQLKYISEKLQEIIAYQAEKH